METKITINFVGDIMLGELVENLGRGVKSKIEQGVDPFKFVKEYLKDADVTVGNLECVLSDTSNREFPFSETLRAPPEYARLLKNAGINIVNLANNHALDHGKEGLINTISSLDKEGIMHFGYSQKSLFQTKPLIVSIRGIKLGFLGYNLSNMTVNDLFKNEKEIISIIEASKSRVDILILSLHWGFEYVNFPSWPFTKLAKDFIEAGADIIYGHHTHQLQGIVRDRGKIIAFSLGNFIFDDLRKENRITGILKVQVDYDQLNFDLVPIYINSNFQPMPCNSQEIRAYISKLNQLAEKHYFEDSTWKKTYDRARFKSWWGHMKNRAWITYRMLQKPTMYYKIFPKLVFRKIITKEGVE